ncbi:putative transcription factor Ovo 1 [Tropilaelaps mercedesae]|uniref:Putative transcription factor Ovo 1 n=1 Tax=Tropilaelaps mercedesae TaxID=418985 RepID=A0A1V9XLT2_9ACAR|nr:putative transcription factor Ovo 1 [Tropilaelaps mercedesae]
MESSRPPNSIVPLAPVLATTLPPIISIRTSPTVTSIAASGERTPSYGGQLAVVSAGSRRSSPSNTGPSYSHGPAQSPDSEHARGEFLSSGECSATPSPGTTPTPSSPLTSPSSAIAAVPPAAKTGPPCSTSTCSLSTAAQSTGAIVHHVTGSGTSPCASLSPSAAPPLAQHPLSDDEVGIGPCAGSDAMWHIPEPAAPQAIFVPPAHQTLIEHVTVGSTSTTCGAGNPHNVPGPQGPVSPVQQPLQMAPLSLISKLPPPSAVEERPPVITRSLVTASIHDERSGAFHAVSTKHQPHIPVSPVAMPSVITPLKPPSTIQPSTTSLNPLASAGISVPGCLPLVDESQLQTSQGPSHMVHRPTPTRMAQMSPVTAAGSGTGQTQPAVPPSQLIARSMRAGATLTGSFTRKPCPYCVNKSFPSYKDLERHLRTHTGERPYPCNLCDYRARQRGALRNHMSKKHGVQMPHLPPI